MSTNPNACTCFGVSAAFSFKFTISGATDPGGCPRCTLLDGMYDLEPVEFVPCAWSGQAPSTCTSTPCGASIAYLDGNYFELDFSNYLYRTYQKDLLSGPFTVSLYQAFGPCGLPSTLTLFPIGPQISFYTYQTNIGGCQSCLTQGCPCPNVDPPYLGQVLRCCKKPCPPSDAPCPGPGCHCCCGEIEVPPIMVPIDRCHFKKECPDCAYELQCVNDQNPNCNNGGGGCGCGGSCGCGCGGGGGSGGSNGGHTCPLDSPQGAQLLKKSCSPVGRLAALGSTLNFSNGNLVVSLPQPQSAPFAPSYDLTYNSIFPTSGAFGYGWSGLFNQSVTQSSSGSGSTISYFADITKGDGGLRRYYSASGATGTWQPMGGAANALVKNSDSSWTETQPNGLALNYSSSTGRLASLVNPAGARWTLSYGTSTMGFDTGRVQSVLDPTGGRTSLVYNSSNYLVRIIDAASRITSFTVDSNGCRLSRNDYALAA